VAGPVSGSTPTPPALRTTSSGPAGLFPAAAGAEAGVRGTGRESAIPSSNFFKGDRPPAEPGLGTQEPVVPD
jgi:hypothetical protein